MCFARSPEVRRVPGAHPMPDCDLCTGDDRSSGMSVPWLQEQRTRASTYLQTWCRLASMCSASSRTVCGVMCYVCGLCQSVAR